MKFTPYHNQVLIKQEEEKETLHGNLIVPDNGKEKPLIGKVISVGPGLCNFYGNLIPMSSKVGDRVAFPSFGGQKITIEDEEFLIYKDPDIFGAIEEGNDERVF